VIIFTNPWARSELALGRVRTGQCKVAPGGGLGGATVAQSCAARLIRQLSANILTLSDVLRTCSSNTESQRMADSVIHSVVDFTWMVTLLSKSPSSKRNEATDSTAPVAAATPASS
jgi:hypothetical protein